VNCLKIAPQYQKEFERERERIRNDTWSVEACSQWDRVTPTQTCTQIYMHTCTLLATLDIAAPSNTSAKRTPHLTYKSFTTNTITQQPSLRYSFTIFMIFILFLDSSFSSAHYAILRYLAFDNAHNAEKMALVKRTVQCRCYCKLNMYLIYSSYSQRVLCNYFTCLKTVVSSLCRGQTFETSSKQWAHINLITAAIYRTIG